MKVKGQHGELGWTGPLENQYPVSKRQIEIDEDERISVRVKNKKTGIEEEIIGYFMPGTLTLEWIKGATVG